jgi:hypothetical protein
MSSIYKSISKIDSYIGTTVFSYSNLVINTNDLLEIKLRINEGLGFKVKGRVEKQDCNEQ